MNNNGLNGLNGFGRGIPSPLNRFNPL